jgi:Ribose/Galactose Isomerase
MRIGIAADHGGFGLKEDLRGRLAAAGHDVINFGATRTESGDDYPDFVIPLARAVAAGKVERGIARLRQRCGCVSLCQQGAWRSRCINQCKRRGGKSGLTGVGSAGFDNP